MLSELTTNVKEDKCSLKAPSIQVSHNVNYVEDEMQRTWGPQVAEEGSEDPRVGGTAELAIWQPVMGQGSTWFISHFHRQYNRCPGAASPPSEVSFLSLPTGIRTMYMIEVVQEGLF